MRNRKKSKAKKWIFTILAICILGFILIVFLRPKRTAYESVTAETGDITTYYSFSGNIEAKNRETVMSEKVMQISELDVKEGDAVEEGDVLMKTTTGDEITAPIDGEIVNLNAEENAQVMAGIKLLDIVDYNNLEIQVKVDEYDISSIEVGKETTISIGALDKELKGTISSISKEGQIQNGITYFTAAIDLAPDADLRVGMSAEVKLISAQVTSVVTLPMSVIRFDTDNSPYVLTEGLKGKAVKTEITVGINDGLTAEIKSGLSQGDKVFDPGTAQTAAGFGAGFGGMRNGGGGNND